MFQQSRGPLRALSQRPASLRNLERDDCNAVHPLISSQEECSQRFPKKLNTLVGRSLDFELLRDRQSSNMRQKGRMHSILGIVMEEE